VRISCETFGEEFGFQPVGLAQGLGTLLQGPLDAHAVGYIEESQHHRAVGQRHAGIVQNRAVGAVQPALARLPVQQPLDGAALVVRPVVDTGDQRTGALDHIGQVGRRFDFGLVQPPQGGKPGVAQLHPAVAAEHRHRLVEVVHRLPGHGVQGVDGSFQG